MTTMVWMNLWQSRTTSQPQYSRNERESRPVSRRWAQSNSIPHKSIPSSSQVEMIVTSLRLWHSQETRHQSEQQNTCQKSKHSSEESSSFHKCELRNKRSKPQPNQAFWTQEGCSSHLKLPQASTSLSTSKSSSRISPSAILRWLEMNKALSTTLEPLSIQPSLI